MKVLGVFAHPDDEVICGWPVMQHADTARYLYLASDNRRGYGPHAIEACKEFCEGEGITYVGCANCDSEFYRLPTRHAERVLNDAVGDIRKGVAKAIDEVSPDYTATHNPIGEYGHGDHRLVFELVADFGIPTLITSISESNACHVSYRQTPPFIVKAYYHTFTKRVMPDIQFYKRAMTIYSMYHSWSWTTELPTKSQKVFLLNE